MASMKIWAGGAVVVLVVGCTSPDQTPQTTTMTTSGPGSTGEITATTIPLPGDSSDGGSTSVADSTGEGGSSSTGGPGTTTTGPDDTTGSTGTDGSTGDAVYDVSWCILQYPPDVMVAVDEAFTVYVRFYAAGLTDLTGGNDPAPELLVELGYGVDGSDPSTGMGAPWTYVPAMPNGGWGPGAPGYSADNDEYQGGLSIDTPGIYDYAARISGDGGTSWVYCDLDDLQNGGYTPDMAGHAEVGQG